MIDTDVETAVSLRRIGAMLVFMASQMDGETAPTVAVADPPRYIPTTIIPSPPVEVMRADASHASELPDPAKIFGNAAALARIGAGDLGKGPTSFEALQPVVPSVPSLPANSATGSAAPATSTAAPSVVELDGAALPWDKRIHSDPPSKNANGLWRMRRSTAKNPCGPELIQAVEAELRANYPAPAPLVPLPPSVPVPPLVGANAPPAPVTPPVGTVQAQVAPGVPAGNESFRMMMDKYSKEMGANGRLNRTVMAPIFAAHGIAGWQDMFKVKPEVIPAITAEAERLLA